MSNQVTFHDTAQTAPLFDKEFFAVFSAAAQVSLNAGESITPMKDEVLLLEEGDLLHYHEGRLLEIVTSVRVLGLAEVLMQKPLAGAFQARNACRLLRLSGHTLR